MNWSVPQPSPAPCSTLRILPKHQPAESIIGDPKDNPAGSGRRRQCIREKIKHGVKIDVSQEKIGWDVRSVPERRGVVSWGRGYKSPGTRRPGTADSYSVTILEARKAALKCGQV